MAHIKIVGADSFGPVPPAQLIKRASNGSLWFDKTGKAAQLTHDRIKEALSKIDHLPGEELIHLIGMGSTEKYASNRNGDGFRWKNLKKYAHTFVDNARWYYDHKSDDPRESYGIVKWANCYEPMHRVELIVALNSTKEAADRNNGKIASRTLDDLHSGRGVDTSMGVGVPWDQCSWCLNKAATRAEYCDKDKCKAGGLKRKMGQVVQVDGHPHHLHADNVELNFHDMSHVRKGADRTAKVLGLLQKAAAAGRVVSGAELGELLEMKLPSYLKAPHPSWSNVAIKLAGWEDKLASPEVWKKYALVTPHVPGPEVYDLEKLGDWLAGAGKDYTMVPLGTFLDGVTYALKRAASNASVRRAVRQELSGIFSRHFRQDSWTDLFDERILDDVPNTPSHAGKAWSEKYAAAYSFNDRALQLRVGYSTLVSESPESCFHKQGASDPAAKVLANAYACYQVQTLASWPEHIRNRALPYVVASNSVTD